MASASNGSGANVVKVHDDVFSTFKALKLKRKHRFMIMTIQESSAEDVGYEVTVSTVGARTATPQEFVAALPTKDSCYAVYDHEFTLSDGRPKSKLYFFVWAHHRSNPHSKMLYTSQKSVLVNALEGIEECILKSEEEALVALGAAEEEGEEEEWDPDDD